MDLEKYTHPTTDNYFLHDDAGRLDLWKAAEDRNLRESLKLSYTERFKIMTRLMRIGNMLSRAKITHRKMT